MTTILVIVAMTTGLWFFWRRHQPFQVPVEPATQARASANEFASVELRCGRPACGSARKLSGQVLLAAEAPALPLGSCDAPACRCGYLKIEDRRQDVGRRASDFGIQAVIYGGSEQREGEDDRRDP